MTTGAQPPTTNDPLRVAVIAGSTRPTRRSPVIAAWVAAADPVDGGVLDDVVLEVVDLAEVDLPLLAEPVAAVFGRYEHQATRAWSELVAGYDAFVLVSPEYNASTTAVLKNALDHLYAEWAGKAVAFVGYGMAGGTHAVEHLRDITAELKMIGVTHAMALTADQVEAGRLEATSADEQYRATMLADLVHTARTHRSQVPDAVTA